MLSTKNLKILKQDREPREEPLYPVLFYLKVPLLF